MVAGMGPSTVPSTLNPEPWSPTAGLWPESNRYHSPRVPSKRSRVTKRTTSCTCRCIRYATTLPAFHFWATSVQYLRFVSQVARADMHRKAEDLMPRAKKSSSTKMEQVITLSPLPSTLNPESENTVTPSPSDPNPSALDPYAAILFPHPSSMKPQFCTP
jgi:hypothetical protein